MSEQVFVTSRIVDDDILVLKLDGKLDQTTAPQLLAEVEKHFAEGKHKLILDCSRLGYVSSYGIGALVNIQTKLRKRGGEVKLASIQSIVANVFKVVRIDALLNIYGDTEFARQSFYGKVPK